MIYEYKATETFEKTLQVDDPGNCCIHGINAEGEEWFLRIKTVMGMTSIIKIGPVVPDLPVLCDGFITEYSKIKYSEKKIDSTIKMFINNPKAELTSVEEIIETQMWDVFPNIKECFEIGDN